MKLSIQAIGIAQEIIAGDEMIAAECIPQNSQGEG
jgi:hypothetical protein